MDKIDQIDRSDEEMSKFMAQGVKSQEQATELMSNLFDKAGPQAVFGEPVKVGDYTVIPASEVWITMGFGFGSGGGSSPVPIPPGTENRNGVVESAAPQEAIGGGGGGGGGGVSTSRPVAVISVGPNGVKVTPIVDPTKFILAFWTGFFKTVGTLIVTRAKRRK